MNRIGRRVIIVEPRRVAGAWVCASIRHLYPSRALWCDVRAALGILATGAERAAG